MDETMGGIGGEEDILSALSMMSDEELLQLMQASNAPNRLSLAEQELQRAISSQTPMGQHRTPIAAALGGVSHMLRSGVGGAQEQQAMAERQRLMQLLEDPASARTILGSVGVTPKQKLLADALRGNAGMGDMPMMPGGA